MENINSKHIITLEEAFNNLKTYSGPHERKFTILRFGKMEILKPLFVECFNRYDGSIKNFQWLPEYDEVISWMENSEGRGLFLTGDCGRGKTNIILGVLQPLYMKFYNKRLSGFHASKLPDKVSMPYESIYRWNFEHYFKWKVAYIDELGVERMCNDFGERFESFNEILNEAEQKLNVLIISSNLTGSDFLSRYGDRTMDRIKRLCRIVEFDGESLRCMSR